MFLFNTFLRQCIITLEKKIKRKKLVPILSNH